MHLALTRYLDKELSEKMKLQLEAFTTMSKPCDHGVDASGDERGLLVTLLTTGLDAQWFALGLLYDAEQEKSLLKRRVAELQSDLEMVSSRR